uniref:Guanylate cyclase domain-containing protein n=1 Tax=Amphora coffeiformis TaxID=265554 RepID=A0A7S3LJJ9_9STRA
MTSNEAKKNNNEDVDATVASDTLVAWCLTTGCDAPTMQHFIRGYASQLQAVGLPVDRIFFAAVVLHSLTATRVWKLMDGTLTETAWSRTEWRDFQQNLATLAESEMNQRMGRAPLYLLMKGAPFVQILVDDEDRPADCDWMVEEGFTELYALPAGTQYNHNYYNDSQKSWQLQQPQHHDQLQSGFTWATRQPGGFTPVQLQVLNQSRMALVASMRLHVARMNAQSLLQTYLGEDAGERVYRGEIERGEGLTVRAAIWFSDVRGFTALSGKLSRPEIVDVLNGVFEVTQRVIRKHQGQVLKFMGDGCMAIFSSETVGFRRTSFTDLQKGDLDAEQGPVVCRRARLAATDLEVELCKLRQEREAKGLHAAAVGVGLHYGDVVYGNVGATDRLDFTVLGPSVNLASRTESLCSKLGAKVLATGDFVKLEGHSHAWKERGEHQVKGVEKPVAVFELVKWCDEGQEESQPFG